MAVLDQIDTSIDAIYFATESGVNNSLAIEHICSQNFTGSLLAKSGSGEIYSIFGYCSGSAQYLRVYDGTSTSDDLVGVTSIAAQNNFFIDFPEKGVKVNNGIFVALSSSPSSHVFTGNDAIITIIWK